MKKLLVASAVIALSFTTASARDRSVVPEATPDGKAVSCVQLNSIQSTRVYGDSVIDFHMRGGQVYRNTLPNSCPSLGFEERFSYQTSISQLCSVDIITVLRTAGIVQGPSCGLGQFQPVKIVKVAAK